MPGPDGHDVSQKSAEYVVKRIRRVNVWGVPEAFEGVAPS